MRAGVCLALAMQLAMSPYAAARATEEKPKSEAAPSATAASDVVLKTMQTELSRATAALAKSDPAPYFLSYTVYDQNVVILAGAYGSLLTDTAVKRRQGDVTTRVWSHQLGKNHVKAGTGGGTSE